MSKKIIKGKKLVSDSAEQVFSEKEMPARDFSEGQTLTQDSLINQDYVLYAVETVSGKVINNRIYDKDSVKDSTTNGGWVKPFNKRLIKNHNSYGDYTVLGKVSSSHFIDLENLAGHVSYDASNPLPREIIDLVISDNKTGDGCGVIEIEANSSYVERLLNMDGTIFSQSSYYEHSTCNVCGKDFYGGDCWHYPGKNYDVEIPGTDMKQTKTCYPICSGDREPAEFSTVVTPANDTSILYIYDKKNKKACRADSFDMSLLTASSPQTTGDSTEKKPVNDNFSKYSNFGVKSEPNTTETTNDSSEPKIELGGEEKMLSDVQKELAKTTVDALMTDCSEEAKAEIGAMLDKVLADEKATEDKILMVVDTAKIVKKVANTTQDAADEKIKALEDRFTKIEESLKNDGSEEEKTSDAETPEEKTEEKTEDTPKEENKKTSDVVNDPKVFLF